MCKSSLSPLPTSMTYAGSTENYTYNDDDELVAVGAMAIAPYNITRKQKNRVIKVSDGIYTHISKYNRYGELKHQRDNVLRVRLFRNKAGQIVRKVEKLKGERKRVYRYTYDERGRLIKVRKNHKTVESYTYDSNGNRASATVYGTTITASYTLDDNLVVYGDNSYLYDDDGYLKEKTTPQGTTTYSYGTRGELLAVTTPTKTITYKHNAKNQRASKEVNGTTVEKYLWENLTTLLAIYDANDNLKQRFEYAEGRMPVAMRDVSGAKYYLHYDQVGSLRAVSDTSHNIVKEISYDTFGNILTDSNPTFKVPFGFAGGLYDSDTKLTRFGYRDYDAYTGKWTAKDPIGFSGGDSNLYGYVLGDPVNGFDPSGLLSEIIEIPIAIGITVGELATAGAAALASLISGDTRDDASSRTAPITPDKRKGLWTCAVVACCNDNIPNNCPKEKNQKCKQAVKSHKNRKIAEQEAEKEAKKRLGCQAKHVTVKCTGPQGQPWTRGGK